MSWPVPLLVLLVLLGLGAALAGEWLRRRQVTVWEWQVGLLFRNGRFLREVPPGRYLSGVGGRVVVVVEAGVRVHASALQESLSADGFPVKLGAVLSWRVTEAPRFHAVSMGRHGTLPDTVQVALQLALRGVVATRGLDALLAVRTEPGALDAELRQHVGAAAAEAGIEVVGLVLRDLVLPAEVRRMVTEVERARREGLAALERARGEQAALRNLANAARLLRGNPELQVLRTLQALTPAPGRPAPTLVLGSGAVLPLVPGTPQPQGPEEGADPEP